MEDAHLRQYEIIFWGPGYQHAGGQAVDNTEQLSPECLVRCLTPEFRYQIGSRSFCLKVSHVALLW